MHRKFLLLLPFVALFAFFTQNLSAQTANCQYTLIMNDTYGDGWNGGILTVTSGAQTTDFTLATGLVDTMTFDVFNGLPLTFTWTAGSFIGEVSYKIVDNIGTVVSQVNSPNMPGSGTLFTGVGACVTCAAPLNFRVENVWDNYAKLRWFANPNSPNPAQQWRVIYGLKGFSLAGGEGDTLLTLNPKITLNGLQKKTWYDAYVEQDCGLPGGFSTVLGPISFETYWTKDVGISGVVSPVSGCELGVDTVRILLTNYGAAPQSLIPMRFTVNGQDVGISKPDDGVYTGVLGKDSIEVFEFETTFDFSAPGEYTIVAYTKFVGDQDVSNDTFTYHVNNRLLSPYTQNFETWNGGWSVSSGNDTPASFEYGTPNKPSIPVVATGQNAWVTHLKGTYDPDELSYLESPCFDFSQLTVNPSISFSIAHDFESEFDGAWLEMSLDGSSVWTKVGGINQGLNWYNEDLVQGTLAGESWSGNSGGWVTARHTLNGAAGHSLVHLRFVAASDATVQLGGLGIDNVRIFPAFNKDLAGTGIVIESDGAQCGLATEPVTFSYANIGAQTQSNYQVAYSVNGGTPVVEMVSGPIAPDQVRSYTFNAKFDSRDVVSVIKCWTKLSGESVPSNDTATFTVDHRPLPTPFHQDFESQALPQGWTSDGTVTNEHGNTSFVLAVNLYQFNPESIHILPRYGTISANDSLSFSYRLVNYSGNNGPTILALGSKFELQVSTDCGETYQTVNTINSLNHTPTTVMRTRKVSLAQFAGQNITIRFLSTWSSGDFWFDLDNINLLSCAADMALSAYVITHPSPGQSNGTATVIVGLGNPPYTYNWNNGATTQTVENLTIGTYSVTVHDAYGCSDSFEFNLGASATQNIESLSSMALHPNPTGGQAIFVAEFNRVVDDARLQVLNLLGQSVWEAQVSNTTSFSERIDLTQLPDGLYLVQLLIDGKVVTKKLLKQ